MQVNPERIKYVDECHFVAKSLWRRLALGPVNERVFVVRNNLMNSMPRGSLSLATSISGFGPLFSACFNTESNSSDHFFAWFLDLVRTQFVAPGDVLIMDNAPIHTQADMLSILLDLCENIGIFIRFQPMYSPEYNAWQDFYVLSILLIDWQWKGVCSNQEPYE